MFEKEAKEYTKENLCKECHNHCREGMCTCAECKKKTFKDGAEFGYNKAKEWQYVKDEKPKDEEFVLIYTDLKNTYVARIPSGKDYFITRRGGFVQMSAVIAWKEIEPPKGSE